MFVIWCSFCFLYIHWYHTWWCN